MCSSSDQTDPEAKAYPSGLTRGLAQLGWIDGRNVRIDIRWAAGSVERMKMLAKELVDLQPDVIVASSTQVTAAVQRETQTIPIVFVTVADPIRAGFVTSLPHPGGNLTGFLNLEVSIAGKLLELLTDLAPSVKSVAVMFNPDTAPGGGSFFLPSVEAAARSLNVELITAQVRSDAEIEIVITAVGRKPGGGIVALPDPFMAVHRAAIISQAARNKVPAVGGLPQSFARDGGFAFLRSGHRRPFSSRRPIRRSHSPWRKASGAARSVADQIRDGGERQDRQSAGPYRS